MCKLVSNRLLLYIHLDRIIHIKDYLSLSVFLFIKIAIQKSKLINQKIEESKKECKDYKVTSEY